MSLLFFIFLFLFCFLGVLGLWVGLSFLLLILFLLFFLFSLLQLLVFLIHLSYGFCFSPFFWFISSNCSGCCVSCWSASFYIFFWSRAHVRTWEQLFHMICQAVSFRQLPLFNNYCLCFSFGLALSLKIVSFIGPPFQDVGDSLLLVICCLDNDLLLVVQVFLVLGFLSFVCFVLLPCLFFFIFFLSPSFSCFFVFYLLLSKSSLAYLLCLFFLCVFLVDPLQCAFGHFAWLGPICMRVCMYVYIKNLSKIWPFLSQNLAKVEWNVCPRFFLLVSPSFFVFLG